MGQATYDDVNLILRLFDMRREERLRKARAWYFSSFRPKSIAEMNQIEPLGSEENTSFRMVVSYWEMVSSFITAGVLNQNLFFQSGRELLVSWIRLKPVVADLRKAYSDPDAFKNLETVGEAFIAHLGKRSYEAFAARVG